VNILPICRKDGKKRKNKMDIEGLILVVIFVAFLYLWAGIAISISIYRSPHFIDSVFDRILLVVNALTWPIFISLLLVFLGLYLLIKWIIKGNIA
jgi:uncharacterized BrkB/YihY/UPF0761 family membrane protein